MDQEGPQHPLREQSCLFLQSVYGQFSCISDQELQSPKGVSKASSMSSQSSGWQCSWGLFYFSAGVAMDLTATASLAVNSFSLYRWYCSTSALASMAACSFHFFSFKVTDTTSQPAYGTAEFPATDCALVMWMDNMSCRMQPHIRE